MIAEAPATTGRVKTRNMAITVTGYIVASVLGLVIGYFLLRVISPDAVPFDL